MWMWEGFTRLNRARKAGVNGPLALELSEIASWLDLHGVRLTEFREAFVHVVGELDEIYLDHWYTEDEKRRKRETAKNKTPRR